MQFARKHFAFASSKKYRLRVLFGATDIIKIYIFLVANEFVLFKTVFQATACYGVWLMYAPQNNTKKLTKAFNVLWVYVRTGTHGKWIGLATHPANSYGFKHFT